MVYSVILDQLATAQINLLTAQINCALINDSYIPSQNHTSYNDILANQIIATNYSPGGKPLLNKTLNNGRFDADDIQWDNMQPSPKPKYAIIYNNSPVNNNDKTLIACYNLINDKINTIDSTDFIIRWNILGILNLAIE